MGIVTWMTGRQAFTETLLAHGVKHIFGNPGTTEAPLMRALEECPQLTYILGLQESAVMGMADGYARSTGRVGVVNLHIAGGLANGLSGLYNAYRGGTPLVATAGQSDTRIVQEEPALWADLAAMARPFTKWAAEAQHPADVPMMVSRAIKTALQAPTGPVFLSLPMDALDGSAEITLPAPMPPLAPPRPDAAGLRRAAELLAGAAAPLILAGDRAAQAGAMDALVRLAETLGARVYVVNPTEPVMPTGHPLFAGVLGPWSPFSNAPLRAADVILAVGANLFNPFVNTPRDVFQPPTRLIQLDSSAWEIGRVYPVDLGLLGDPKSGLEELLELLQDRLSPERREAARATLESAARDRAARQAAWEREARAHWEATPIAPARLALELRDALPANALVIDEGLTTSGPLHRAIKFNQPRGYFSIQGGAIGWGCGAAVGAALGRPDRKIVAVIGDGSLSYSLQALWTAAHYRLPITYIVCNNRAYRILKMNMLRYLGEGAPRPTFLGLDLDDPAIRWDRLAEGFGVRAWRVDQPAALRRALDAALAANEPTLLDVAIDGDV